MRSESTSAIEVYKWFVAKEKSIYNAMNYMRQGTSTYIGYMWCPTATEDEVRTSLRQFPTTEFKRYENHTIKPPTYIKNNEFTGSFQEIVNTYGIPMYKEANPAVFAIVTFPFLFGVMFGDIGHGSLLLLGGIILCLLADKLKKAGLEGFASIRYLILLMGLFATFNGIIYNEFFAIPTSLFSSCYTDEVKVLTNLVNGTMPSNYGYMRTSTNCVYPLGFDPRWFESDQLLTYSNNFKMKTAVIFGVMQMSIGIFLKGFNSIYFKRGLDFAYEFIPQILLLLGLFGWMDVMIIGKWLTKKNIDDIYVENSPDFITIHKAPAIITTMIDMFLA